MGKCIKVTVLSPPGEVPPPEEKPPEEKPPEEGVTPPTERKIDMTLVAVVVTIVIAVIVAKFFLK